MTTKAPKLTPITGEVALAMRKKLHVNQSEFWSRVGLGQSAGSRYETGRSIPKATQMLLRLAYGTQAQAARQLEVLRPSITTEETEESAS